MSQGNIQDRRSHNNCWGSKSKMYSKCGTPLNTPWSPTPPLHSWIIDLCSFSQFNSRWWQGETRHREQVVCMESMCVFVRFPNVQVYRGYTHIQVCVCVCVYTFISSLHLGFLLSLFSKIKLTEFYFVLLCRVFSLFSFPTSHNVSGPYEKLKSLSIDECVYGDFT